MEPFPAADILRVWEIGQAQHPLDRALTILATMDPARSRAELARLPIGERDRLLLAARAATAGDRLDGYAACPGCGEGVEFAIVVSDLLAAGKAAPPSPDTVYRLAAGNLAIDYRLPTSVDLAAAVGCAEPAAARALLATRCVVAVSEGDEESPATALPEAALDALETDMAARDPLAEIALDLTCPACGHRWATALDVGAFFWAELAAHARRLLREVDALAHAYGWSEAAILALSAPRRRAYLALAT